MNDLKYYLNLLGFICVFQSQTLKGQDTIVIQDQDLQSGMNVWSKDHIYLLDGSVTLEGGTLEIEAGTQIIAQRNPSTGLQGSSGLVISSEAKLYAEGSIEEPIVFTSDSVEAGRWMGLRIQGMPGTSSGAIEFTSIRGAGSSGMDGPGSGLILEEVDASTSVHHIEVFQSSGDGIRIVGGTVNIAYAAVSYAADDAFEWSAGWIGGGIYWYANSIGTAVFEQPEDPYGSFAIEGKGSDTLISNPVIFHATLIGQNCGALTRSVKGGIGLFENSMGTIANSMILHFPDFGLQVDDKMGSNTDSYGALGNGLKITNNGWFDFGRDFSSNAGNAFQAGSGGLICVDSLSEDTSAQELVQHLGQNSNLLLTDGIIKNLAGSCIAVDPRVSKQSNHADVPNFPFPSLDFFGSFQMQEEKGAFSSDLWIKEWTALDEFALVGEEGYGTYLFDGQTLQQFDTLIVSCEDLSILQDSLIFSFPCRTFQYQVGASHRKSNPRRRRPPSRNEELEYAFIEEWSFSSSDLSGCSDSRELNLTVLVIDTIAPIIHPIPDGSGGLTAILEDCDESWIIEKVIDTIGSIPDDLLISYTFIAEDYSGNQSQQEVRLHAGQDSMRFFADLDGDGYGNPDLMIYAKDSIPGFVDNNLDCNDENAMVYPGSPFPLSDLLPVDISCTDTLPNYDLCQDAFEVPLGMVCTDIQGTLDFAEASKFSIPNRSCLPRNYADVWLKLTMPASGGIFIQLREDFFRYLDVEGFGRLFMLEIYSGECQNLNWEYCHASAESSLFIEFEARNLAGQEIFLRVMEAGNKNEAPFDICVVDLNNKVTNDFCNSASSLDFMTSDTCSLVETNNFNALPGQSDFDAECGSIYRPPSIWFELQNVADTFELLVQKVTGSAFQSPIVSIHEGTCDDLTEVTCLRLDNATSFRQAIDLTGSARPLYLRMYDALGEQGTVQLGVCQALTTNDRQTLKRSPNLLLYPNPIGTAQILRLKISSLSGPIDLDLMEINGHVLQTQHINEASIHNEMTIRVSEIPAGLYVIRLRSSEAVFTQKILVFD